jgi:hypothetical protein
MKATSTSISIVTLAAALAMSAAVSAQWPSFVRKDVPRTSEGKPDLAAPAPRMADGKPDLSGLWENAPIGSGAGRRGEPPRLAPGEPPLATFFNIGAGFPGGLPFRPWAKELLDKRRADNDKDNPDAHCLPMGLLQFHEHPQPRKIVQTKDVVLIVYEANYGLRQIFIDGRPLPNNDPTPWWYGYSAGHWDGDTLVVETTSLRDGGWLDIWGSPLTDQAKITERFRRLTYGALQIDVTIDDQKAYTRPFTVRFNQRLSPGDELIEFICNENEQSSKHLLGNNNGGAPSRVTVTVDSKVLDGYVGRYQMAPGAFITITRQNNQLLGKLGELPPFEMYPTSPKDFYITNFDARFAFEVDAQGKTTAIVMHTDTDVRAPRVR